MKVSLASGFKHYASLSTFSFQGIIMRCVNLFFNVVTELEYERIPVFFAWPMLLLVGKIRNYDFLKFLR